MTKTEATSEQETIAMLGKIALAKKTEKTAVMKEVPCLRSIFNEGFRDCDIRRLILQQLSFTDLQSLSAVSRTTRDFLYHGQNTSKALRAAIRLQDFAHPLFHRLYAQLQGRQKLALRETTQRSSKLAWEQSLKAALTAEFGGDWAVIRRSRSGHFLASSEDKTAWVVLDDSGKAHQLWRLGVRGYFVGVSDSGKHWLAVSEYDTMTVSYQLHVFCNGNLLHIIYPEMPFQVFTAADDVQLCPAWGRLYLAVVRSSDKSMGFIIRLYSLGTQNEFGTEILSTWPKLIYKAEISSSDILFYFNRDPFFARIKGNQLWLSRLTKIGQLEVLHLLVERGGEAVRLLRQPIRLPAEFLTWPGESRMPRPIQGLGIGDRLLALMPAPAEPETPPVVALLAWAEGAWTLCCSLQLSIPTMGTVSLLSAVGYCSNQGSGDKFRWLQQDVLDEGLSLADFASGEPWLELCQTEVSGSHQHRTVFFPPALD